MKKSTQRSLTTHVGNLHRPPDLELMTYAKFNGQPYDHEALAVRLRSGVAEVVRKQADAGIAIVNDGEYSKSVWSGYAHYRLTGVEKRPPAPAAGAPQGKEQRDFAQFFADVEPDGPRTPSARTGWTPQASVIEPPATWVVTGPLKYQPEEIQRDIDNLKAALRAVQVEEAFMPVMGPAQFVQGHKNEYYPSEEAYYFAVADALREEYLAITKAGFIAQLDDLSMTGLHRRLVREGEMTSFRKAAGLVVEAMNHALKGIPPEMVRMHLCWGGYNTPHREDPALKDFADLLMKMNVQGYAIEAANPRHAHEWKVWKDVKLPEGKVLIPGVINTKTNVIDHPEYIAERIVQYASLVGRENVIGGTDCGLNRRMHPQIAWAKLESLAEGAKLATKELWRH